jgi:NADPH:quinone reductase-like Zn-dependent oxidoreductase
MKAAIVTAYGSTPTYGDFPDQVAGAGERHIRVSAAALSQITRGHAAGRHYSSAPATFPFVPGIDGTGRLDDGRRVYFVMPRPPLGSMAEQVVVAGRQCVPLPDTLDDVTAAAIANPGMSSWGALVERARLRPGETVLVNGATGISGRLAVQIAKHLGAARVIATGRNPAALDSLHALGADVVIPLTADDAARDAQFEQVFAEGVDVVLDYLWGDSARALLVAAAKAGAGAVPIRFVQIGSVSGAEIDLPSAVLRASAIELRGSGIGSISVERLIASIAGVFDAVEPAGLRIATKAIPLAEIGQTWNEEGAERIVFTIPG